MYQQVQTDKGIILDNGSQATPVATLADEHGGRAQIVVDDRCYIILIKQKDGRYKMTSWIFAGAHEALAKLPSPA